MEQFVGTTNGKIIHYTTFSPMQRCPLVLIYKTYARLSVRNKRHHQSCDTDEWLFNL
jgi:hypothetical protein